MIKTREVVFETGKTGSGKSILLRQMLLDKPRVIIFDTISEYKDLTPSYPALFIHTLEDLIDYLMENGNKPFRIIFDPEDPDYLMTLTNEQEITVFDFTCKFIYESLTNVIFAIEEIANYMTLPHRLDYIRKIVRFGRHSAISLYATTQRPADIPPVIRAQITRFISFRQHEPRDIEWIRQLLGEEALTLKNLEKYTWGKPLVQGKHYKEYML